MSPEFRQLRDRVSREAGFLLNVRPEAKSVSPPREPPIRSNSPRYRTTPQSIGPEALSLAFDDS
jgi:hypothetical protein